MKITAWLLISLACISSCVTGASASVDELQAQMTPAQRSQSRFYLAALQFCAALSGEQMGQLAAGRPLELASLSEEARSQVLDAVQLGAGSLYADWKGRLASNEPLVITLTPQVEVVLTGDQFGPSRTAVLSLNRLVASLSHEGVANPPSVPIFPAPPQLDSILSAAPSDAQDRVQWFRGKAQSVLLPLADVRLKLGNVQFSAADFARRHAAEVSGLTQAQSAWLGALYGKYAADVCARQAILQRVKETTGEAAKSVIVDASTGTVADPATTPTYTLPLWPKIAGGTVVELSISISLAIKAADPRKGGVGWAVE